MRWFILVVLVGCGFTAPGGEHQPIDASKSTDAQKPGDGPTLDAPVDVQIDAPAGAQCPITYTPILALNASTSRYRFVNTTATWIGAEQDCENDSGAGELPSHLIVLDDAPEKTAMIGGLAGGGNINDQYVGATDLDQEAQLQYVTSQQVTLSLTPGMNADNKDCVRIKNTGVEEFRSCDETNKYVCECDGNAANPSRFPNLPNGNN